VAPAAAHCAITQVFWTQPLFIWWHPMRSHREEGSPTNPNQSESSWEACIPLKTVHLISGLPCSGKTTYSNRLSEQVDGVHFWLDYWLITLYGAYDIDEIGHDEHARRVLACRELIWDQAVEFLKRDVDVILDDGFFLREHRSRCIAKAKAIGARAKIHYLD